MNNQIIFPGRFAPPKLGPEGISLGALAASATPCLNWCHEFLWQPPKQVEISNVFRSSSLEKAAKRVFPLSCHTKFDECVVAEFENFSDLRTKLAPASRLGHEEVTREIRRPKALLVTNWSA